ncbi:hypothetical protein PENSPDRAFT_687692 [Peniophora sp. CONT]|nr:hypothetical protein PENSPDRAFT_687692 [Peniophora sp. CONT]
MIDGPDYAKYQPIAGLAGRAPILDAIQARVGFFDALTRNKTHVDSRSTRRALLDDELTSIKISLADLRRRRNLLSLASACPPEVLTSIFRFLSELELNYYADPKDFLGVVSGKLPPRMGWMKVIQVCYSWRRAAQSDGLLWTTATTGLGMHWTSEMLRLSRNFPIHLDVQVTESSGDDQDIHFSLLSEHVHRLAGLQIMSDGTQLGERKLYENMCKASAPLLESLTFYLRGSQGAVPVNIFSGYAPELKRVYVHNVEPPWNMLGPRITDLTLILDDNRDSNLWVPSFMGVLSRLPNLKLLCIKNYGFHINADDVTSPSYPIARCPFLSTIILHYDEISGAMFILTHIVSHGRARISLAGLYRRGHHPTPTQDAAVVLFREYMADSPISADMRTVEWRSYGVSHTPIREEDNRVDTVYERTLTLSAWRTNCPNYLLADYAGYRTPPLPDFKLTLGLQGHRVREFSPEDILPWPQPFTSARNVSLQMTARFPFEVSSWSNMLGGLPNLRWLRVDRELAEDFLDDVGLSEALLPKSVETLVLLGIHWGTSADDDIEDSPDQMLANVWRNTRELGGALSEVIIGSLAYNARSWHECINEAEVVLDSVQRLEVLDESNEDWDERTDW